MLGGRGARRLLAAGVAVALAAIAGMALGWSMGGGHAARTAADLDRFGAGFRDGRVSVDGTNLHYVIGGKGPPVMLIAGFPETWYAWRKVMPALARGHTVVAVDPPGIGGSDVRRGGYDADSVAASLHALAERLELGRVSLVGHDLGGWFAYAYARRYRTEVDRLAILEAGLPGLGLERKLDFSEEGRGELAHIVFFMEPAVPEALLEGRERYFIARFLGRQRPGTFSARAVDDYVHAYSGRARLTAALGQYRAFYEDAAENRAGRLPLLEMPVLALGGSRGVGDLTLRDAQRAARHVRGGIVPAAGHWLMEERPGELVRRLLEFLPRR